MINIYQSVNDNFLAWINLYAALFTVLLSDILISNQCIHPKKCLSIAPSPFTAQNSLTRFTHKHNFLHSMPATSIQKIDYALHAIPCCHLCLNRDTGFTGSCSSLVDSEPPLIGARLMLAGCMHSSILPTYSSIPPPNFDAMRSLTTVSIKQAYLYSECKIAAEPLPEHDR